MDKKIVIEALQTLRKDAKDRKFTQSIDFVINLKDLDLKKQEQQVDFYFKAPHGLGKNRKVCALVGPELVDDAKKVFDRTIIHSDFTTIDKTAAKKLAEEFDFFVAQANVMSKVAASFGRVFGPRGKMPNPKAGCVVPPKADLNAIKANLASTIRLQAKSSPIIQVRIGSTEMDDDKIAENILSLYDAIVHHLPQEKNNLKTGLLKLTMSKAVKVF
ncbi:MAG: large subunit ribosomal protein L1 [Candidatus Woesearchaeota archaeon]|jgi:large subunit ribosomal protein L1